MENHSFLLTILVHALLRFLEHLFWSPPSTPKTYVRCFHTIVVMAEVVLFPVYTHRVREHSVNSDNIKHL